jgi:hypothetical protein
VKRREQDRDRERAGMRQKEDKVLVELERGQGRTRKCA